MFSDLDDDLSRIRQGVLGREPGANVAFICDDEELRLYVARSGSRQRNPARSRGEGAQPPTK